MKRILVVDNDDGVRKMLDQAIRSLGYAASLAASGAEALEVYRSQKIDFVLLDLRMPEMDGPATLAALQTIDPGVCCCFMSASCVLTADEIADLGAGGFVPKPFSLEKLGNLISECCNGS
jgi:DNA-binding NtrC family response regulator